MSSQESMFADQQQQARDPRQEMRPVNPDPREQPQERLREQPSYEGGYGGSGEESYQEAIPTGVQWGGEKLQPQRREGVIEADGWPQLFL